MEEIKNEDNSVEQQAEKAVLEQKLNLFVSGSAGTGKSYLLRHLVELLQKKYNEEDNSITVLCPTGLAASLVGGITIHRFLGRGIGIHQSSDIIITPEKKDRISKAIRKRVLTTKVIVFDEISMVSPRLFIYVHLLLQSVLNIFKPFGGCQVICIGDFLQLPPVPDNVSNSYNNSMTPDVKVEELYLEPNPVYCFQTTLWKDLFATESGIRIHLFQPRRQARSLDFFDLLGRISMGILTTEDYTQLQQQCSSTKIWPNDGIRPTTLHSLVRTTIDENTREYSKLPEDEPEVTYEANISFLSRNIPEYIKSQMKTDILYYFDSLSHLEFVTKFKKGAQVMLVRNISVQDHLINGSRGVVESVNVDTCQVVVRFISHGGCIRVFSPEVFTMKYQYRNGTKYDIGIRQFPLKLAWALTIHKCQGMTLDRVNLNCSGIFAPGQFYVALSRARNLNCVNLSNFNQRIVKADPIAIQFLNEMPIFENDTKMCSDI